MKPTCWCCGDDLNNNRAIEEGECMDEGCAGKTYDEVQEAKKMEISIEACELMNRVMEHQPPFNVFADLPKTEWKDAGWNVVDIIDKGAKKMEITNINEAVTGFFMDASDGANLVRKNLSTINGWLREECTKDQWARLKIREEIGMRRKQLELLREYWRLESHIQGSK